jgi:Mn2+/Fe2+ NRAMP family transporter
MIAALIAVIMADRTEPTPALRMVQALLLFALPFTHTGRDHHDTNGPRDP